MATTKETAAAKTATTPPVPLTLQQKFIKLREAVPSITQKAHSDGVKYKFAKIFDVYQLLTPAMNEFGVNFDIVGEQATRHSENGDPIYYSNFTQHTRNGDRIVWVYEADLTIRWTNADNTQWAEGVLDTFGGSGTTLIAAESVGQPAYVMEMEPAFVDVIVKRYIKTTGKTTGIRLFRKGKELGREHFERMFTE